MKEKGERRLWVFSAEIHHLQGILVVEAAGEIDLASVPELRAAVERAVGELDGPMTPLAPVLVLDLSRVSFMECRGLGFLIEQRKKLLEHGGELKLILGEGNGSAGGAADKLLRLTSLEEEFSIYPDAEAAVVLL